MAWRGAGGEGGAAFFLRSLSGFLCVLRGAKHKPFAREEKALRHPPVSVCPEMRYDAAFGGIWVSEVHGGVVCGMGVARLLCTLSPDCPDCQVGRRTANCFTLARGLGRGWRSVFSSFALGLFTRFAGRKSQALRSLRKSASPTPGRAFVGMPPLAAFRVHGSWSEWCLVCGMGRHVSVSGACT